MQTGAGTITMRGSHKKAPPKAGPENESRLQSGLGRGDQRSGNTLAEATAPAEGGSGTEEGQGAGNCGGRRRWCTDYDLNGVKCGVGVRAVLGLERPGSEQACGGEADARKSFGIKSGCGSN